MKFLRINVKVLLILCLFSGILFLSTGCDDKDKDKDKKDNNKTEQVDKKPDDNKNDGSTDTNTDNNGTTTTENGNSTTTNSSTTSTTKDTTDYSVWVANTTINTDKNQRSYKVIWGDTLWLISTAWEIPYQEIARYNHIPNPDLIYVDQIIYNPRFK